MHELTAFDKINLAVCAVQRAQPHYMNRERFDGEFATAMLWKGHRVVQTQISGKPWAYVSQA